MGIETALLALSGLNVAGQIHGAEEARKDRKKQRDMIEQQRKEQERQQADEKKRIAAEKQLASRKKGAEEGLAAGVAKQERRRKSKGREGTILTEGVGPIGGEAPAAEGETLLGGSNKKKNVLGL